MNSSAKKQFIMVHLCAVAAILLFPLYLFLVQKIHPALTGCAMHDILFLYCPLCGGTRAIKALLRLDVVSAFSYNPFVFLLLVLFVVLDVLAFLRLRRGESRPFVFPRKLWLSFCALFVLWGILRNVLMIAFGIDSTGDLVLFWNAVMGRGA